MSRFFKSAAFPILIVVRMAFLAVKLVNPGTPRTTALRTATRRSWSAPSCPTEKSNRLSSRTRAKSSKSSSTPKSGNKETYEVGYIDQAAA